MMFCIVLSIVLLLTTVGSHKANGLKCTPSIVKLFGCIVLLSFVQDTMLGSKVLFSDINHIDI